jgi:hypothetical protein
MKVMRQANSRTLTQRAARWRLLSRSVKDIKKSNANVEVEKLQAIIDEAVREVRTERGRKPKRRKP